MVTPLGYFQVGVVARGEFDSVIGDQINKRVVRLCLWNVMAHRGHHILVGGRASHAQHFRVQIFDPLRIVSGAHATRDDNAPVFRQCFADGIERFLLGAIDKSSCVHDDQIGAYV